MKKALHNKAMALLMTLAMVISLMPAMTLFASAAAWDGSAVSSSLSGGGTSSDDPFLIASGADLKYLANNCASSSGKFYKLTANIDLDNNVWTPIGNDTNSFGGTFDGNGYKISNFYEYSNLQCVGLFGYALNATIKNVGAEGADIASSLPGSYVGALVGCASGCTITNSYAVGSISGGSLSSEGGLVGDAADSDITASYTDVICSGTAKYVGGLVGTSESTSTITKCYATGIVMCSDQTTTSTAAGGLVGLNNNSDITESYATGNVTCGATTGSNTAYAGGLVGGTTGKLDGGVQYGSITDCYAAGSVTCGTGSSAGGLAGYFDSCTLSKCYWNTNSVTSGFGTVSSGSSTTGSTGMNSADMKLEAFVTTLGATIWKADITPYKNSGYPMLTGVGVGAAVSPAITSALYNADTGVLAVTGSDMAADDVIAVNKLTITGQGGNTYTLAGSYSVASSSDTAFSVTLTVADKLNVNGLLNKTGASAVSGTAYNLAGAAGWDSTKSAAADTTGNAITVSSVQTPTLTSAVYNAGTGVLTVTGTNMIKQSGTANDIDVSKLTLKGEGDSLYTLTDSTDVELTSGTEFTVTLNSTDRAAVNIRLNKNGTSSTGGTAYNLAAGDDWNGTIADADTSDAANAVTVNSVPVPTITSAAYNAGTGALVVTGTGFLKFNGDTNDIDVSKLTLKGEGGATCTLSTTNVEITSGTEFTVMLSPADKTAVNLIFNKSGASSTGTTTYNLAAAEDWAAGAADGVTDEDLTGNGITVSNVPVPTITSATYDAGTGYLVVTGTGFLKLNGDTNDIDVSMLTLKGEGETTYTLTDSPNAELTSGTAFTVSLSPTDKAAVNIRLNNNGASSTGGTTYNLAAADNWAAGAADGVTDEDLTGNGITVSSVPVPTITGAIYSTATGVLVVTGTGFLLKTGTTNDIDVSMLTFTGGSGTSYTLTNSPDAELTSGTAFTVSLSTTDKAAVNLLLDKNGTSSTGGTTYNLAAAENWAVGAAVGVTDEDLTGNGITVTLPVPTITSATYNAVTGDLVVTGTDFTAKTGVTNDIDVSMLTLKGEGNSPYTLTDSTDAELSSSTEFTVTLSPTDKAAVNIRLNMNGTSSTGGTTYNLAAAEDWAAGADPDATVADLTGNGITVSSVPVPTITSATYDFSTGYLVVNGTGFLKFSGDTNDIDVSMLTFTGGSGTSYTLTNSPDAELTSGTAFTVSLSPTDKAAVNLLLNKNGSSSTGSTTYNLAAAENWAAGADVSVNFSDLTGNGVTVSNVPVPTITSAAYNVSSATITVTGTGFLPNAGAANDVDVTKLTLTGEGGATYILTTNGVEITSDTAFSVKLNSADEAAVNQILNKNGASSTGGTLYNLAAAENWALGADTDVTVADLTGNTITVSNVPVPTVTSVTYNASTGVLVVTGTGMLKLSGTANDIDTSKFTLTGEGGATYTLTNSADVEIASGSAFLVTLSATDKAAVNQMLNKNGTSSTGTTTYNLAAAEDWAAGAEPSAVVSDLTGNGVTVSNVAVPAITSAAYDFNTGALAVTGTGFLKLNGNANDIDVSKLTLKGEGAVTYTLTDSPDVEITSGTAFTVTLSSTDKTAVNLLLNKNGASSTGSTTYNLAAAENWAAGAASGVVDEDLTGNGVTVSNVPAPANFGGDGTTGSAAVEVNGQKQDAGTTSTQTTGGQTVTTIKVDDAKLDNILEGSGARPTVTLPGGTDSDTVVGELSGQTIKNMESKEATLEIKTDTVTYTLPASEINIGAVSQQLGTNVALKDIKVSVTIAEPSADTVKIVEDTANKNSYQLVMKPVEFTISCSSEGKTVDVSKFNGYVERTLAIPDGVDPSKITTGIVLNADGSFSHVPTTIVKIGEKYYAKISSLTNSTYSVIYNPIEFTDVARHWAKAAINDMGSRMIVTGVGNSTYEPDRSITRAEFAAIVVRAMGLQKGTTESSFGDVTLSDWFNGYVDTATAYSLITGYDSSSYGPNDTITREQAMTILARAMKLTGLSVSTTDSEAAALLAAYTDGAGVSSFAKMGVGQCLKAGVVTGSSATTLSPKAYVTRAEVAVMVQRLLQKSGLI